MNKYNPKQIPKYALIDSSGKIIETFKYKIVLEQEKYRLDLMCLQKLKIVILNEKGEVDDDSN